jgi:hypothetical protein
MYWWARQIDTYPAAFRWQIMRRGEPMSVQIGDDGFPSYLAARLAGRPGAGRFP